ncbi:uncharacterized protein LOC120346666 [Styela clava]|uniref:uncharacterized protein LOC120344097 n=1 Tax=Styela clava TaxID=7725 RepID=UPI001939282A|nr:uncharacterized protein LOC120344097 [Styela clava]XP_039272394.1 uncharacterized protein LOC120346666 [Styela clava]
MRISATHLLVAVLLCIPFLQEAESARRRRRCYLRLCYKCQMYVNSRGKRSIIDGENEFDTPDNPLEDDVEIRFHQSRKGKIPRWTERNTRQMSMMINAEQDIFDIVNPAYIDPSPQEEKFDVSIKSKGRHRKRSVSSHVGRCLYLLRSKCCRDYHNLATYIGYRMKKV